MPGSKVSSPGKLSIAESVNLWRDRALPEINFWWVGETPTENWCLTLSKGKWAVLNFQCTVQEQQRDLPYQPLKKILRRLSRRLI